MKAGAKDIAKELYLNTNLTNKEIAKMVGVAERTISGADGWIKKNKWDDLKAATATSRDNIVRDLYHNIATIQKQARDEERALSAKETDQIVKLTKSIEQIKGSLNVGNVIAVNSLLLRYIAKTRPDLVEVFSKIQTELIHLFMDGEYK